MRLGPARPIVNTLALLLAGGLAGVLVTLLVLLSLRPRDVALVERAPLSTPLPTSTAQGSTPPAALVTPSVSASPRAEATPSSDLTVTVLKEVLVAVANKQAADTFEKYRLRDPRWTLGDDNTVTLDATATLPALGADVAVRITSVLVARGGALQVDVLSIALGGITVTGGALAGLAGDLNRDLASAIDPTRFEVQDVRTTPEAVTLRLRVVGDLSARSSASSSRSTLAAVSSTLRSDPPRRLVEESQHPQEPTTYAGVA